MLIHTVYLNVVEMEISLLICHDKDSNIVFPTYMLHIIDLN